VFLINLSGKIEWGRGPQAIEQLSNLLGALVSVCDVEAQNGLWVLQDGTMTRKQCGRAELPHPFQRRQVFA
jgi:hypothetical protein